MKKCQKCFYENSDLMSFCGECGTLLPNSTQNLSDIQGFPTQSLTDRPTIWQPNSETDTIDKRFNFASAPPPPEKPSNGKLFLIIGGTVSLLVLGVATFAGIIIYKSIPTPKPVVPLTYTPTPGVSPSPQITPNVSFTPPTEPTKQGSFTIYANKGWQLSNIDTVPNEEFKTTVQGKINLANIKTNVAANGVNDDKYKSRRIYPEFPTGALLMRTRYADGNFSNVTSLMSNGANGVWLNYPDERGKIEFCLNDNAPQNNAGQFVVTVKMTRIVPTKKN